MQKYNLHWIFHVNLWRQDVFPRVAAMGFGKNIDKKYLLLYNWIIIYCAKDDYIE